MTASEYQIWLATLTFEQRQAVEMAVGIVLDLQLMLEGRMSVTEAELKEQNKRIESMNKRIAELERRVYVYATTAAN